MKMIQMKVSELVGTALDWAVFVCLFQGMQPTIKTIESTQPFPKAMLLEYHGMCGVELWHPSTNWVQAGALIERFSIDIEHDSESISGHWRAFTWNKLQPKRGLPRGTLCCAETPLVAVCRAFVVSTIADKKGVSLMIEVPAELVQESSNEKD